MTDETKAQVAALKRKAAAYREQGAEAKAAELEWEANALQRSNEPDLTALPDSPRTYPSPKEAAPKVKDSPKTAETKPQTKRGSSDKSAF